MEPFGAAPYLGQMSNGILSPRPSVQQTVAHLRRSARGLGLKPGYIAAFFEGLKAHASTVFAATGPRFAFCCCGVPFDFAPFLRRFVRLGPRPRLETRCPGLEGPTP